MASIGFYTRASLQEHISKLSDRALVEYETILTVRMGNINKFCPWPALEESLAQDIAMIWREQRLRYLNKGKEK